MMLSAVLLAVVAGLLWFVIGLPLTAGLLRGAAETAVRKTYGFDEANVLRLAFLAVVVCVTGLVAPSATGKWLALGAIGAVAALIEPEHGPGAALSTLLLVFAVPGVLEMVAPVRQAIAAVVSGLVVALPAAMDAHLAVGPTIGVAVLRGVLFFAPLLLASPLLERWVLKRAGL
jgi:hypothetical protein